MEEEAQNHPKICSKSIKINQIVEEDRISKLPNSLICEILSRLPFTKDAIRTGTLSKRWNHLWTSIPSLNYKHRFNIDPLSVFYSFVNKTLISQRGQFKLNKFKLEVGYDIPVQSDYIQFESHINKSLRYAMDCNVEDLDLRLFNMEVNAEFLPPQFVFTSSCFTNLKLDGCLFKPAGVISWGKLVNLCICDVKLDEALIANILSGSPVLETLNLKDCDGYKRLDITSKSVKNLVLDGYKIDPEHRFANADDESDMVLEDVIEINAPYILSLTIKSRLFLWKILLLNVSCLVKANLNFVKKGSCETTRKEEEEEIFKGLVQTLCHVKVLEIGNDCLKVLSRLKTKGFVCPSNLKVLDVIASPLYGYDSDSDENSGYDDFDDEGSGYGDNGYCD